VCSDLKRQWQWSGFDNNWRPYTRLWGAGGLQAAGVE
jgi:hypothetical protein